MKFATYYEKHMSFFIKRLFVPSMLLVLSGFCLPDGVPCAADRITEDNLPQLLEKALLEHPDIVLDVLRRNSEAVLDIAQQGSNMRRKRNLETQWREDTKTPKSVRLAGRPALGSPKAKVNVVAFSDFTCHFCQQASKTVDALLREYGKDISLVFKNLPFDEKGPGGQAAAYFVAISQQSEEKAWKFYKVLFADRDRLVTEGEDFLKKTAQDLEVDMKRLARDIRSKKVSDILAEDQQDAQKLGVEGTPYFLVNNLVVRGALPLDLFKGAVDMALQTERQVRR